MASSTPAAADLDRWAQMADRSSKEIETLFEYWDHNASRNSPYTCTCGAQFTTHQSLVTHHVHYCKIPAAGTPAVAVYVCGQCGEERGEHSNLQRHIVERHEPHRAKLWYCQYRGCQHKGPRKCNVQRHMLSKHQLRVELSDMVSSAPSSSSTSSSAFPLAPPPTTNPSRSQLAPPPFSHAQFHPSYITADERDQQEQLQRDQQWDQQIELQPLQLYREPAPMESLDLHDFAALSQENPDRSGFDAFECLDEPFPGLFSDASFELLPFLLENDFDFDLALSKPASIDPSLFSF